MCDEHQHREKMTQLEAIEKLLKQREPIDDTIQISAARGWNLDYKGRKHIFLWLPGNSAINLDFGAYGAGPVQPQVWTNVGFKAGTTISAPDFTGGNVTTICIRCTDEIVP